MSAIDLAVARLKVDEGFRSAAYIDTTGHRTIGYGFNIDAGISETAAAALLTAQTQDIAQTLSQYAWAQLDDPRLSVVIEIAFNIGMNGLMQFVNMIAALGAKNWQRAHDELVDSTADRQLPQRYNALAKILLTGVLP